MKKIPVKNYFVYLCICLLTFLLLLLFVSRASKMQITKKSVLNGFLYEITETNAILNLKSYSVDNPNFILYVSNHNDDMFEIKFKEYIENNELKNGIIYLNGWNKLDNSFVDKFRYELFDASLNISTTALKQSNVYLFKDGRITSALYYNKKNISIDDVKNYIERLGDISND